MPSNGATLGSPSVARVNINDIDKGGVVTLSAASYSVNEGAGNISITVKRTGGNAANVSVLLTTGGGTATGGVDYGNVSTTVVFGLNDTTRTVLIPIFQDTDAEGNETFNVTLSNPSQGVTLGTPSTAVVTIVDDESAIRFAQAAFDTKEGTQGKIVVVRSGALVTQAVVPYNISSVSAFPGVDFTGPVSGTLTFKPKDTQAFFMIPTVNNSKVDGNRSVLITLGAPTGGALLSSPSTAAFTIVDDDQPGVFRMGSATYTVKEGGSVVVDIMRLPAPGAGGPLGGNISVAYATSNGNASAGEDFTHVSGIAVFGPMDTKKSITVPTLPDTLVDPGKNFFFTLSAPTGGATLGSPATANILIQDDDSAGVVFFSQKAYSVSETAGNVSITVMRTGGSANASVHFATMAGTASFGEGAAIGRPARGEAPVGNDFGFVSTTLFFGAGEMKKTVVIPIYDDSRGEGDEVFFVRLSNPQGGLKLGSPANASVTIVDNEVVIQFSGRFKNNQPEVVRTGPLGANVSVQYVATSGTAIQGDDFILEPGTLIFAPGVSSRTIPIKTLNDNIAEGPETFTITLMNPTPPAQLGPFFEQIFTLDDNDFGGVLNFGNTSPTAALGQSKPIVVTRANGLGTVMTVGWSAIGGTAVAGTDFSPASGSFTFLANQSAQTFFVNISAAPAAAGKTIVFGLMPPGLNADPPSSKLGPANVSTLTILVPQGGYAYTVLYSGGATVGLPSINDNGGFAFSVNAGMPTIYTGNMETPAALRIAATLPSGDVSSLAGNRFPADSGEAVAFKAGLGTSPSNGLAVASNGSANAIYANFDPVGEPSLSLNGSLAFKGTVDCEGPCDALYLGPRDDVSVAAEDGDTTDVGFLHLIGPNTGVNNGGLAAFIGETYSGNKGVFTTLGGGAVTTVASTAGGAFSNFGASVAINDDEAVAFIGLMMDGNSSVFLAYDGGTMPVATASPGGFAGFDDNTSPVISNTGAVAFVAYFDDETSGIFLGPDPVRDRVVGTGDTIGGREVVALELGGINNIGQISFRATLYDGEFLEDAAIVATPTCSQCSRPPLALQRTVRR